MEDMFKNEIFGTLEPPHGAIIKAGISLPTNQDIYFASKWNELFAEDGSFQYLGNEILNDGIMQIPDYQYRIKE